jgi:plasmid stabilization system protein ParE
MSPSIARTALSHEVTRLILAAEAQADIAEAIEWLNGRSTELPPRFRAALEDAFASIIERPELYPVVHRKVRRTLLHHFPNRLMLARVRGSPLPFASASLHHNSRDSPRFARQ